MHVNLHKPNNCAAFREAAREYHNYLFSKTLPLPKRGPVRLALKLATKYPTVQIQANTYNNYLFIVQSNVKYKEQKRDYLQRAKYTEANFTESYTHHTHTKMN